MFDAKSVSKLSIPGWEAVYRAEITPGVVSLIAIHNSLRGPALGGCRMAHYENESEALTDVLRLSRGMTFKNAIAHLPLGGGKSIIVCDPKVEGERRDAILGEFGRFVSWVNRNRIRYYTAEDMNTTVRDMHQVAKNTDYIHGTQVDPSPYTAWGVFCAIEHAAAYFAEDLFDGMGSLQGKSVLLQGLGKVGLTLLGHLHEAGARVIVSDIREEAIQLAKDLYPGTESVAADQAMSTPVDIFAPCAAGEVIHKYNHDSVPFKIVCGAANNQLQNQEMGQRLQSRGVVYCPDYIANMGGVCCIQYIEVDKDNNELCLEKIKQSVRHSLNLTFEKGFRENIAFNQAVGLVVDEMLGSSTLKAVTFSNQDLFPKLGTVAL